MLRLNNGLNDKNNNTLNGTTTVIDTPLLTARNPNTTWPISPIPIYSNNNNNLRDCDSPAVVSCFEHYIFYREI